MRPEPDQRSALRFHLLSMLHECHREHHVLADDDRIALCARPRLAQEAHPRAKTHLRRAVERWQAGRKEAG